MKKSEAFYLAQDAVLDSAYRNDIKIGILRELIEAENLALFTEKQEETKAEKED